ncbi:MAG: hypothetical protein CL878_11655 [Dehalococcoidia bacterium]|nr:hypothetical protein [Dehalococcoidia bacterium]
MFDIGGMELVVILIVAVFVIGPERIPEAARTLGRFIGQLRQLGGDIGDPIQQVRQALHEGMEEGEALAHQIQADVESAQEDIRTAASIDSDQASAEQTAEEAGTAQSALESEAAALRETARQAAAVMAGDNHAAPPLDADVSEEALRSDDSTDADEDFDPVQQAIAAIEANDEYAPIEPMPDDADTSDGDDDDDTYNPILDTWSLRSDDPPADAEEAAKAVGPSEGQGEQVPTGGRDDSEAPAGASSHQEEVIGAKAGLGPENGEVDASARALAGQGQSVAPDADGQAEAIASDTEAESDIPLSTDVAPPTTSTDAGDEPDSRPNDGATTAGFTPASGHDTEPDGPVGPIAAPGEPAENDDPSQTAAPHWPVPATPDGPLATEDVAEVGTANEGRDPPVEPQPEDDISPTGVIAAGMQEGGSDSGMTAEAREDATSVLLEPTLYEALQGTDISPEERARELIVLGLFREGRMTAQRAAWHLGLSDQQFDDLLAYKGISVA